MASFHLLSFSYQTPAFGFDTDSQAWSNPSDYSWIRPLKSGNTTYALLDMDGDGVLDRVTTQADAGYDFIDVWYRRTNFGDTGYNESEQWPDPAGWPDYDWKSIRSKGQGANIKSDVIDMNGDGLPDRVAVKANLQDKENFYVWLNTGSGFATGEGFPITWNNQSYHTDNNCGEGITNPEKCAVIDLNGDGLPDRLVWKDPANPGDPYWSVHWNNGVNGFSPEPTSWSNPSIQQESYYRNIIKTTDQGKKTIADVFDINGDGLVDRVVGNGATWQVYLGNGRTGFEEKIDWKNLSGRSSIRHVEGDSQDVRADVFDINGDGLPDRVVCDSSTCTGDSAWRVYLNNGSGFLATAVSWENPSGPSPFPEIRDAQNLVIRADIMDMNGDGMLDRITCNASGCTQYDWRFYSALGPKPDLLSDIDNGLGGKITIEYAPSTFYKFSDGGDINRSCPNLPFIMQTVHRVTRDDGRGTANSVIQTRYYYEGGLYDGASREFRGFAYVETIGDEVAGLTGDVRPVTVTQFHQDPQLKGLVDLKAAYDIPIQTEEDDLARLVALTDSPLAMTDPSYVKQDLADPTHFTDPNNIGVDYDSAVEGVYLAHLIRTDAFTYDSNPATVKERRTQFIYDDYGNVIEEQVLGDTDTDADGYVRKTTYIQNLSLWIMNTPQVVSKELEDGTQLLEKSWVFYDRSTTLGVPPSRGDITMRSFWLNESPGNDGSDPLHNDNPVTQLAYDQDGNGYGNVVEIKDPNQVENPALGSLVTIYEDFYHTFPERIINPLGHQKVYTYDPGFGQILTETDGNGNVSELVYDEFGRQIKAYAKEAGTPGQGTLLREITYNLAGGPQVQNITTNEYFDTGTNDSIESVAYFDGLGRTYLEQTEGEDGKVVLATRLYNRHGRVEWESFPYFSVGEDPKFRKYEYDAMGRVKYVLNPDGTYSTAGYEDWTVVPQMFALGGALEQKRVVFHDAFGRVKKVAEFENAGTGPSAVTEYFYDPVGNLINIHDAVAVANPGQNPIDGKRHITTITYDSLNRKKNMDDPDMGFWSYTYDKVGNLKTQTDARGQTITFNYDALNRIALKDYPNTTFDIVYEYDGLPANCPSSGATNLIGRLTAVKDQPGCESYAYDFLGRTVKTTRVVGNYKFEKTFTYDLLDRVKSTIYPDGETVEYRYEQGPLLQEVVSDPGSSVTKHAWNIDYDARGQITGMDLGQEAGGSGAVLQMGYAYHPTTFRLTDMGAFRAVSPQQVLFNRTYSHYPTGDVENIIDNLDASNYRDFVYDDLSRLTQATGPYGAGGAPVDLDYIYDLTGNLRFMDWNNAPELDLGRELTYDNSSFPQPHAVNSVIEGTQTTTLTYDDNGNPLTKGSITFSWDWDNRLTTVGGLPNSGTETHFYDYGGNRVLKTYTDSGGTKTIIYAGGDFEWDPAENRANKFLFVNGMRVASLGSAWTAPSASGGFVGWPDRWKPSAETLSGLGIAAFWVLFFLVFFRFESWRLAYGHGWLGVALKSSGVVVLAVVFLIQTSPVVRAQSQGSWVHSEEVLYYVTDHLGSTSMVVDETGAVRESVEYYPFGAKLTGSGDLDLHHKFTGQELDEETGFYYYGARYYDPAMGRFLTPDPFVQDGFDPQSLNRYSYVRNNPLRYTDPSGNFFLELFLIVVTTFIESFAMEYVGSLIAGESFNAGQAAKTAGIDAGIAAVSYVVGKIATKVKAFVKNIVKIRRINPKLAKAVSSTVKLAQIAGQGYDAYLAHERGGYRAVGLQVVSDIMWSQSQPGWHPPMELYDIRAGDRQLNPDSFVLVNPQVRDAVRELYLGIVEELGHENFTYQVTGGDRYVGARGGIRSLTTGKIIPHATSLKSEHLVRRGRRGADLRIWGVPDEVVDRVITGTALWPYNTVRGYKDKHTHVALPPLQQYKFP